MFMSAQAVHQVHVANAGIESRPLEIMSHMRQLAETYVEAVEEVVRDATLAPSIRSNHLDILRVLSLAVLLFFPQDGQGDSLVGEELLDWLNSYGDGDGWGVICDRANGLATRVREWDQDEWESTVCVAILRGPQVGQRLLESLADSHPEPGVASFAKILATALRTMPRSRNVGEYPTTAKFGAAHQQWRDQVAAEISLFCQDKQDTGGWLELESDPSDGFDGASDVLEIEQARWEETLGRFAKLVLGDPGAVLQVVEECCGSDWRVALGCWGVLVDVDLERDRVDEQGWTDGGLRETVDEVTTRLGRGGTSLVDEIMMSMCQHEVTKVSYHAKLEFANMS